MNDPLFLTLDEVLQLHAYQIKNFGGVEGILDIGLLESAIAMPRQGFGGTYLHPDLASMAAAYLFHIISNHAFQDGNKRAARKKGRKRVGNRLTHGRLSDSMWSMSRKPRRCPGGLAFSRATGIMPPSSGCGPRHGSARRVVFASALMP